MLELRHGERTFVADFVAARKLKREKAALKEEAGRSARKSVMLGISGGNSMR